MIAHITKLACLSALCVVLNASAARSQPSAARSRARDVAAIVVADSALHAAVFIHDAARTAAFYTDSASMLPSGAPIVTGRDAVRRSWEQLFASPVSLISSKLAVARVSRNGELGYTQGSYEFSFPGADGKPVVQKGKFLTVWTKSSDGSWKILEDAFNADAR